MYITLYYIILCSELCTLLHGFMSKHLIILVYNITQIIMIPIIIITTTTIITRMLFTDIIMIAIQE